MQYIAGENLKGELRRAGEPLPVENVVRYAGAVAEILAYLHSQRPEPVMHRDIKPANVIVDTQGRVKLVDFGLAKALPTTTGKLTAARHTTAAGTAGYTPLEQWMLLAEPRSDVYALGATMHHLLTGRDPRDAFTGQGPLNLEMLRRLSVLPPLRTLRADAPPSLDVLLSRMVAEQPADRPTVEEVQGALIRVQVALTRKARAATATAVRPATPPAVSAPVVQGFPPLAHSALHTEIAGWLRTVLVNLPVDEPVALVSANGELLPVGLVPYQVAARFENSAGQALHQVDEAGQLALDGATARPLNPALSRFVAAHSAHLQPLDAAPTAGTPEPPPRLPFKAAPRKLEDRPVWRWSPPIATRCNTPAATGGVTPSSARSSRSI